MDIHEFDLLPRKLGWKYELIGGKPYITPAQVVVHVSIAVEPRPVHAPCPIRPVTPDDRQALIDGFREAFRDSVEYFGWPEPRFERSALECIERYFGGKHPPMTEISRLAVEKDGAVVIGAALVIRKKQGPYLDLLFVRPLWQRHGVATALVASALNALHAAGERTLASAYDLANEPSRFWHRKFGFVEEPDLFLAQRYARHARHELRRREKIGDLTEQEREALQKECDYWGARVEELEVIAERDGLAAVMPLMYRD